MSNDYKEEPRCFGLDIALGQNLPPPTIQTSTWSDSLSRDAGSNESSILAYLLLGEVEIERRCPATKAAFLAWEHEAGRLLVSGISRREIDVVLRKLVCDSRCRNPCRRRGLRELCKAIFYPVQTTMLTWLEGEELNYLLYPNSWACWRA